MKFTLLLAFVGIALSTKTWTGEGVNNLWDDIANWDPPAPPTKDDDVVIGDNFDILIGTSQGGIGKSLQLGSSKVQILGCNLTIGSGGITLSGTAELTVNSGAGLVSVAAGGKGELKDTAKLSWASGSISGDWVVGAKAQVNAASHGNLLTWTEGSLEVNGLFSIQDSSNLHFNGKIKNNGKISVVGPATIPPPEPVTLWNFQVVVDTTSTGQITLDGHVRVRDFTGQNVAIQGRTEIAPQATATFLTATISATGTFVANEPSNTTVESLNSIGKIEANGYFAQIWVKGSTTINSIYLNVGRIYFMGDAQIASVSSLGGGLSFEKTGTIASFASNGTQSIEGAGSVDLTGDAVAYGILKVGATLNVKKNFKLHTKFLTLDGNFAVADTAHLEVSDVVSFWGPSNAKAPGKLWNDGIITINKPNATFNSIKYTGAGSWVLVDSLVDFQNVNVSVNSVSLSTKSSVLKGESLTLSYKNFYGPSPGSVVNFIIDDRLTQCTSPCASSTSTSPYQVFRAWVS
jgi:hypothetical protein